MSTHYLQKYRPALHFAPKQNWMNDPNGMVFFKGEYHLFFQYNPYDSVWGPMHWGHAVSKDMITWEELDIALFPDEHGTIFSGSAVVDWGNSTGFFPDEPGLVAIFTHHLDKHSDEPPVQSQSLAYSLDQGRTWTKYEKNPVLTHDTKVDFRDPKVFWHNETERWVMVLATGQTISFYSSHNLIDWVFESEFGSGAGSHEGVWECPDLFELKVKGSDESRWVLFVSIGDNHQFESGSRTQYFTGDFNGTVFSPDHGAVKWLDYGKDNYAGVSFSDIPAVDGRRIYLGWMSNWRYANEVPTDGWRSQMTLPRELTLTKNKMGVYTVIQQPVNELGSYFVNKEAIQEVLADETKHYSINEANVDIMLNIQNIDADTYGITLHHTEKQHTVIKIDSEAKILKFDRKDSGEVSFSDIFAHSQEINLNCADNLRLRLIIDSSSVELFVNGGEHVLTSLIYPDKACENVSLFAESGKISIINGRISCPVK